MPLSLKIENDIAIIDIDHGKVNAANMELLGQLETALNQAEDQAKAVIIYGGQGKFCAGFDLEVMQSGDIEARDQLVRFGGQLVQRLYGFPIPVIIAAAGFGIALGAIFLLAADVRIGVKDAKYGLNETQLGMDLPNFGLELAKDRIPPAHLTESILFAKIYNGEEAVSSGYLDMVTEPEAVLPTALHIAKQVAQLPQQTFANHKLRIRREALEAMKD